LTRNQLYRPCDKQQPLANMDDSASKALKEYEQILTGGSGKMGRHLNKDFSSWND
jgi:hypothetical protein